RGYENREKIPEDIRTREGILRVRASPERGRQRVLREESGLEQRTANKMRTAPLWGLRVRPQLMHDGLSLTIDDAIRRHGGAARRGPLTHAPLGSRPEPTSLIRPQTGRGPPRGERSFLNQGMNDRSSGRRVMIAGSAAAGAATPRRTEVKLTKDGFLAHLKTK